MSEWVVAVDPGREKCGVAAVHRARGAVRQKIVSTKDLPDEVRALLEGRTRTVVLGDGTTSQQALRALETALRDLGPEIVLVDERQSTDAARRRYWEKNPPRGLRRFWPVTMQTPPGPVDDYVAVILAERYFAASD